MDTDSSISETCQDECQFLAMEHDEFLGLDPVHEYAQSEDAGQSAILVDVVTGSLVLSNSVSVSTDGPVTAKDNTSVPGAIPSSNPHPVQTVQPIFINRAPPAPAALKTVPSMPGPSNSFNSSRPGAAPLAFIAVGNWLPQDCNGGFPMSPTMDAFGTSNSINSQVSALSGSVLPFLPMAWPLGAWPAAHVQNAGPLQHSAAMPAAGGPCSPAMARWLATDDGQCRTPEAAAAAVVAPAAPMAPAFGRFARAL